MVVHICKIGDVLENYFYHVGPPENFFNLELKS